MLNLWYKNAIIYCIDLDSFMDGNGDGNGDFEGLAHRLDHVETLGATCVWLLPFYPSPKRDNGYDITDYLNVDPRFGDLGRFVEFMAAAQDRGIRVIVDLVVNHTSIEHPWFHAARDPESVFHDWYIWADEKPADAEQGIVFPGVQKSTWTYDRKARKYYFHRFYDFQADLNVNNPMVREEILRIMGFWLALGLSGFRIDAVPFLIEGLTGPTDRNWMPEKYLNEMNRFLSWRRAEAILLAEANIPLEQADQYFGDGERMHLVFNFVLNQQLFLALSRGDASPVAGVLRNLPEIGMTPQWATFLRNHDEIDLGRLTDAEREEVFAAMGPEKSMQIYGRGLRRRLAPMLGNDQNRIKMAFSLMFALPGTPVIWYGDEIGMGDDQSLPERNAVRTPMQWTSEFNGGFSDVPRERCARPPITGGEYGYERVNVASQRFVTDSLFETVQRLVRLRRSLPEIGWGKIEVLDAGAPSLLGLVSRWEGNMVMTVHNLAGTPASATLGDALPPDARPLFTSAPDGDCATDLEGYGFRWWKLRQG